MQNNRLWGGRWSVDSLPFLIMISLYEINNGGGYCTPSPTRLFPPQRYVERCPHDAASWGAGRRRTELSVSRSLVIYIANTTRSMPLTILVSCRSAGAYELPLGFHCSSIESVELFLFCLWSRGKICLLPTSVVASRRCFRYASGTSTILYTRRTGGHVNTTCLHEASATVYIIKSSSESLGIRDRPLLKVTCPNGSSSHLNYSPSELPVTVDGAQKVVDLKMKCWWSSRFRNGIYSYRNPAYADQYATSCTSSPYRVMIACDALVQPADEFRHFVLLFCWTDELKKVIQIIEKESLFVPCPEAILPVYVFMYTNRVRASL